MEVCDKKILFSNKNKSYIIQQNSIHLKVLTSSEIYKFQYIKEHVRMKSRINLFSDIKQLYESLKLKLLRSVKYYEYQTIINQTHILDRILNLTSQRTA